MDTSGVRPVTIVGDADGLARAVSNLLDNARRHARSRVEASLRAVGDHAELRVANDGPPIPPGVRESIFERFTRLDEGRARDEGGAGLGLAIVREIVQAHGGQVRAEDPASGACFVVSLPLKRTSPPGRS